jgi:hypothetical protein
MYIHLLLTFNRLIQCSLFPAFLDRYVQYRPQYNAAISYTQSMPGRKLGGRHNSGEISSNRAGTKRLSHRKCVNESIKYKVQVGIKCLRLSSKLLTRVFLECVPVDLYIDSGSKYR